MPGSGILSIGAYRDRLLMKKPMDGITPPEVAMALKGHAATTLQLLSQMPEKVTDKELRFTLGDLKAMAHLGNYYAEKILGATDLALFDKTGKAELKESAVKHLQEALEHWKAYAATATRQYRPQLLTRIGYVDLSALIEKARQDVEMASNWKPQKP
jgi:hypothetical protein